MRINELALACFGLMCALPLAASPQLQLDFESIEDSESLVVHTQFDKADQVDGITGKAWRTDGFSSWGEVAIPKLDGDEFSLFFWMVLESHPSDLEVPLRQLTPSSFVHQKGKQSGFDLHVDAFGRWGIKVFGLGRAKSLMAPSVFPLRQWTQVGFVVAGGELRLFQNGERVAERTLSKKQRFQLSSDPLVLARGRESVEFLNFELNGLNGAYDDFSVYNQAVSDEDILRAYRDVRKRALDPEAALIVPASRFANDHLRPRYRAMPPANWTNEPHGMVRKGDTWHLFYQRTPDGPYKTHMHWGHMASDDLVSWRHLPDALWPQLQNEKYGFDMKGIWSGDVILDGERAFAFYTSVNYGDRLANSNPGVSMAVSSDPELTHWKKTGPIINTKHVKDFRDPYLWREENTWHMIIGAALETGGGLDYYVLTPGERGATWKHRERFISTGYRFLDIGSIIWEMPVFEPIGAGKHVLVVNPIGGSVHKYGDPATRAVYWVGRWSDGLFTPSQKKPKFLDVIPGHLAPTVARAKDGSLRAIGIVDERRTPQSQEDAGWAHTFSLPRTWRLMADGVTLGQASAEEIKALRAETIVDIEKSRLENSELDLAIDRHAYELEIELAGSTPDNVVMIDLQASRDRTEFTRIRFDTASGGITLDKRRANLAETDEGPLEVVGQYDEQAFGEIDKIHVFVDGSVVDVFVNKSAAFAFRSYPSKPNSNGAYIHLDGAASIAVRGWAFGSPRLAGVLHSRSLGSDG